MNKSMQYKEVRKSLESQLQGESDAIAMMATIACELKHAFDEISWVGFYRVVKPGLLKVGPYQGGHGCIDISFDRGVCGRCAMEQRTQLVPDVSALPYHIACSSETKSEIVVPVFDSKGRVIAVLDMDSESESSFDETDAEQLEAICALFAAAQI